MVADDLPVKEAHLPLAMGGDIRLMGDDNYCSAIPIQAAKNLHDFQTGYPEIKIRIQNNTTPEILNSLQNGRLDLAVVTTPFELHDALACEDLLTFREVPAGGPDYAALSDRPMTLKEFGLNYEKRHTKQGIQTNLSLKEESYGDWLPKCDEPTAT